MTFVAPSLAVIGGGLSGLAISYYAALSHCCKVHVFDSEPMGQGGASKLASLMHPHTPSGKLIWKGLEGIDASLELMQFASNYTLSKDASVFFSQNRAIRRPCLTPEHVSTFSKAATLHPEYITYTPTLGQKYLGIAEFSRSYTINTPVYLQCLARGLNDRGVTTSHQKMSPADLPQLSRQFDTIVLCAGASIREFLGVLPTDRMTLVRGQNVIYRPLQGSSSAPNSALICGEYLVPRTDGSLLCGATHEYNQETLYDEANLSVALSQLTAPLQNLLPDITTSFTPVEAVAGVRVVPRRTHQGRIPQIGQHPGYANVWFLTGLGSHGLVHHAYLAKLLTNRIFLGEDDAALPLEAQYTVG